MRISSGTKKYKITINSKNDIDECERVEVYGEPVPSRLGVNAFVHKTYVVLHDTDGKQMNWTVSELCTGMALSHGETKKDAILSYIKFTENSDVFVGDKGETERAIYLSKNIIYSLWKHGFANDPQKVDY